MSARAAKARRLACAASLAASFALATSSARADDGPITALKNMFRASPTLTIATSTVVILADIGITAVVSVDAARGLDSDQGLHLVEIGVAAPQALLFAAAPFFFDIDEWKPEENMLLLFPFTAWSGALLTHGIWSLSSTEVEPLTRLGVSGLVGLNWALTTEGVACLSRGKAAPQEIAIAEVVVGAGETALSIERAVSVKDASLEWGLLAGWSAVILGHGIASLVIGTKSEPEPDYLGENQASFSPWLAPSDGGLTVGAAGAF
ncbi:MAG: hypothetical protein HOW73_46580 [Polyangiaceae bacterium]|nr:hypothetical protein [Polyangiaceae bacterium]